MRAPLADDQVGRAREPRGGRDAFRAALLSVYCASLGSRFEVRGAPSVLLSPQIRLLPVPEALGRLSASTTRLLEGVWLLVRATPLRGPDDAPQERYPTVLRDYVSQPQLQELSRLRRHYRAGSTLFAAALEACRDCAAEQASEQVEAILRALRATLGDPGQGFSAATHLVFGQSAPDFVESMMGADAWRRTREQITKIEAEVGLDLHRFVAEFASAVAFREFVCDVLEWVPRSLAETTLDVLPVSSAVVQDTASLQTTATVTTLVSGEFEGLRWATDPRSWADSSDVIQSCRFVTSPFPSAGDSMGASDPRGVGYEGTRLLEEEAALSWGSDDDQHSSFHNILQVTHKVAAGEEQKDQRIDVGFSLCRSIDSSVLWDQRAGGLLVDDGFLKACPVGNGSWRVTSKKTLRFSDRTPFANRTGWTDFGQLLNYLAPAALSWWLETETYSLGDRPYTDTQADGVPTSGEGGRDD